MDIVLSCDLMPDSRVIPSAHTKGWHRKRKKGKRKKEKKKTEQNAVKKSVYCWKFLGLLEIVSK